MNFKEIADTLRSIDISLQQIAANATGRKTTAFVNRKSVANRLGVPLVKIDQLIHSGLVSAGKCGLVEGRHYCKLSPSDTNTSDFLYDVAIILEDAWSGFKGYERRD